jgi:hypothetical protein
MCLGAIGAFENLYADPLGETGRGTQTIAFRSASSLDR